ncbi:MAG: toxin TcdB middle/N-terminal domain-containing protein, partial [Myxococcota bacterium]
SETYRPAFPSDGVDGVETWERAAQAVQSSFRAMQDLNGDGLSDLVVVVGANVKFALNRNGSQFSDVITLTNTDVDGEAFPQREASTTVLYADMNGNGSNDVVWLTAEGDVTYLELFPVRPNQLSTIENGIGQVTEVTYGTSVQHMARDGGWEQWAHRLPHPMLVVDQVDRYDRLTNVHEVTAYQYHDGFYDGVEKQFRGYGRVDILQQGDETQEEGRTVLSFDVGATDPYRSGLMLHQATFSDDAPISESATTYTDCPLADIPEQTALPIRFVCPTVQTQTIQERAEASQWATLTSEMTYDGYGNVVLSADLGVTAIGGEGCGACARDAAEFGTPCGTQCVGDEMYTAIDYIEPGAETTAGHWILGTPYRQRQYGRPGSDLATERLTFYDEGEEPFEGMPLGQLGRGQGQLGLGKVTRVVEKVSADSTITTVRNRYDTDGNIIETLGPLATTDGTTHRRLYTMDADKLRVVSIDVLLNDPEGNPYRLRRKVQYEPLFDQVVSNSAWILVMDNEERSDSRTTQYDYDAFGRLLATAEPGDTLDMPTHIFDYDLGNPTSRIITRSRSVRGEPTDIETITCVDG